ncbi:potassium transporter KefB [Runella salmonicolor]|uniref:Potassium transporter KefB n=1 Tax=Runella salmonicolor TaxID=2950278 RepID=A0ABT1FKQ2_9BACT|nr:potassium transporter KefB [Runella salmonicolor]MCP1382334.1 potassium transporter KefB [Runella salmonicolor]
MTKRNHLTTPPIHPASLVKPTLVGAGIALTVITIFLLGVREPNPAWGKLWMLRPLIIVPLAGAMGGAFFFFMDYQRQRGNWSKILTYLVSLIGFFFVLWIGIVLGLDGTLWD